METATVTQSAAKKTWETRRKKIASNYVFQNTNGIEKIKRREQKANAYKESGLTSGCLLFMPSQTCADVEQIKTTIPYNSFKFVGSEISEIAQKAILKKIRKEKFNMSLFPHSISEAVKLAKKDDFSHADFDFCETFSRYYNVIAQSVKKDIVQKNGVISMTFAARDKNITKVAPKFLGKKRFDAIQKAKAISNKDPEARLVIPTVTIFLNKLCKSGRYKIVCAPETYTDSKVGNHMVFAMIQRIK